MENKKEGKVSVLTLIVLIIIVALVSVGGTYMYMNSKKESNSDNGEQNANQIEEETVNETKKDEEDKEKELFKRLHTTLLKGFDSVKDKIRENLKIVNENGDLVLLFGSKF